MRLQCLTKIIIAVLAMAALTYAQVIAMDTAGIVVEVKEKYGCLLIDTGTVLMIQDGCFVLTKRDGATAWWPMSFHSVRVIERIGREADK